MKNNLIRASQHLLATNIMDKPNGTLGTLVDFHHTSRKARRIVVNGIVALTNTIKPAVAKVYDIAPGGVSFVWANEMDITENILEMDILIFDIQTGFEFLINQVTGRLKSQELVSDPINKVPTRRYGVEFVDLDRVTQKNLDVFFTRIQQTTTQDYYESYQNSWYYS